MSAVENPPAFPPAITSSASDGLYYGPDGMALRDWFAGQAPISIGDAFAACDGGHLLNLTKAEDREFVWRVLTQLRYEYADAMLVARTTERKGTAE